MAEPTPSAQLRAFLGARQLLLDGVLRPGDRVSELVLASKLNLSRTPVRAALAKLHEEGLLLPASGGGYLVREFKPEDIYDAVAVRGAVEGLAARFAAERGVPVLTLSRLRACVAALDDVLADDRVNQDVQPYLELNDEFHRLLGEAAQSAMVVEMIGRATRLPFASPNGFILVQGHMPSLAQHLRASQQEHRAILEAIERADPEQAERLTREHSHASTDYIRAALEPSSKSGRTKPSEQISPLAHRSPAAPERRRKASR